MADTTEQIIPTQLTATQIDALLAYLRDKLAALYGEGLKGLWLFGSYARGDATPHSDVDIAVVLDDAAYDSDDLDRLASDVFYEAGLRFDAPASRIRLRLSEFERAMMPLVRNILREGREITGAQYTFPTEPGDEMSEVIEPLLEQSRESLNGARYLLEGHFYAFAASRAYYAMFYAAQAMLAAIGVTPSSHRETKGQFGFHFARLGRIDPRFHEMLIQSFEDRQDADYRNPLKITEAIAKERVAQAEEFLDMARAFIEANAANPPPEATGAET